MSQQIQKPQCSACGTFNEEIRLVKYSSWDGDLKYLPTKTLPETMYLERCKNCTINPDEDHEWEGYEDTIQQRKEREEWWNNSPISNQEELGKLMPL